MDGPAVPALIPVAIAGSIKQETPIQERTMPVPSSLSASVATPTSAAALPAPAKPEEPAKTPVESIQTDQVAPAVQAAQPATSVQAVQPAAAVQPAEKPTESTEPVNQPETEVKPTSPSKFSEDQSKSASPESEDKEDLRHELLRPTQTMCLNCMTTNTPLWRRDENGQILCNACGLFLKLHGRRRPISLKTDVIKSRNRSRNTGPSRRFNRKQARSQHVDSLRQFPGNQMPTPLVPAPSAGQHPPVQAQTPQVQTQIPQQHTQTGIGAPQGTGQTQLPPVSQVSAQAQSQLQAAQAGAQNAQLLGQMRQPMHPIHMVPPVAAGLSPALTAYNFYPTGTPILGAQPGLQPMGTMQQAMSPHFGPLPGRPSSPPDFRLVRGHLSEQLLPRSPPDRIAPLNHVHATDIQHTSKPAPNTQELQTKVSELEVINDLLRRRITDLEFSESKARKEAAEAKTRLEELQNLLRQAPTPAEPSVSTPDNSGAAAAAKPAAGVIPVSHSAPEPAAKEVKRIRVSELV